MKTEHLEAQSQRRNLRFYEFFDKSDESWEELETRVRITSMNILKLMKLPSKLKEHMSQCMRFPTMWNVRPAKPQISLHIRAV